MKARFVLGLTASLASAAPASAVTLLLAAGGGGGSVFNGNLGDPGRVTQAGGAGNSFTN